MIAKPRYFFWVYPFSFEPILVLYTWHANKNGRATEGMTFGYDVVSTSFKATSSWQLKMWDDPPLESEDTP